MDVYGHGTHVAGTACAEDNGNGTTSFGVVGVAPSCSLYSLRVLNDDGAGDWSDMIAALEWALGYDLGYDTGQRLDIVNLSLGSDQDPGTTVKQAFDNAEAQGLFIVAAAGNSGNPPGRGNSVIYPAKYESVVAVSATDDKDRRPNWSSTGEQVELAAPGVSVYSTWNDETSYHDPQPVCGKDANEDDGCYKYGSGTSMASPHVAGVAALVIEAGVTDGDGDGFINDEVRTILNSTAKDIGTSGKDEFYGYGLVDAFAAVNGVPGDVNSPPVANAGGDQKVTDGDDNGFETVTLDGTESYDSDGTIVSYKWYEGDSSLGSGETFSYDFALGTHAVTLEITDDDQAKATDEVIIEVVEDTTTEPTDISLIATARKVRGMHKADLQWSSATSTNVDVYRDGAFVITTANDGFYTDDIDQRGPATYTYKVCEAGTEVCSNTATIVF